MIEGISRISGTFVVISYLDHMRLEWNGLNVKRSRMQKKKKATKAEPAATWVHCGFCKGRFLGTGKFGCPGFEKHRTSLQHQLKLKAVESRQDPEAREFCEFFGLPV